MRSRIGDEKRLVSVAGFDDELIRQTKCAIRRVSAGGSRMPVFSMAYGPDSSLLSSEPAYNKRPPERPRRLAVADSDIPAGRDLASALEALRYEVIVTAQTGEDVLGLARTGQLDLIAVGVLMPAAPGESLLSAMRHPPTVAVLGTDLRECASAGGPREFGSRLGFLVRPLSPQRVESAIDRTWAEFRESVAREHRHVQLQAMLDQCGVISRATWRLVEECNLMEAEASEYLARISSVRGRPLADTARDILAMTTDELGPVVVST